MLLKIDRSQPFNPEQFEGLGKGWRIAEQDARALTITELDPSKIQFETTLQPGEPSVGGEEKLARLKKVYIRLDVQIFKTFWKNKQLIPESWKTKGRIYFDGTVFLGPDNGRCVLCLHWAGGGWRWHYYWLESAWYARGPSAVLASSCLPTGGPE